MKIFKLLGRNKALAGSVGIEVEIEGENLPHIDNETWRTEHDGSLKTREAYEYVLKKPVSYASASSTVDMLESHLSSSVIYNSERAGVHVHINMQQDTVPSLGSFLCLYYTFETALMNFCGNKRAGNLFCLRLRDAEYPIDRLLFSLKNRTFKFLQTDNLRYGSLNLKALPEYGSVEFRGMRSTSDFSQIKKWIRLLLKLRKYARTLKGPSDIPEIINDLGPVKFAELVFGEEASLLTCQAGFEASVLEDYLRITQLIHSKEWVEDFIPQPKEVKSRYAEVIWEEIN